MAGCVVAPRRKRLAGSRRCTTSRRPPPPFPPLPLALLGARRATPLRARFPRAPLGHGVLLAGFVLQGRVSSGGTPLRRGRHAIHHEGARLCAEPQSLSRALQSPHVPLQSVGQASLLHDRRSLPPSRSFALSSQEMPLPDAGVLTSKVRVCSPGPHPRGQPAPHSTDPMTEASPDPGGLLNGLLHGLLKTSSSVPDRRGASRQGRPRFALRKTPGPPRFSGDSGPPALARGRAY